MDSLFKRIRQKMEFHMVELLAPAGDRECFSAALRAGADAVYIGGERFGARAYAPNFTQRDVIWAVDTAHLYGRKVYLTVNTLLKEDELKELVSYLEPFYEAGLDGVIVQDFGALAAMRQSFPDMELHASTQMTVTGAGGASLLKEAGICRIVPARELSLEEIIQIKKRTQLEVETFVHGAMCYAYSGQCLFSSMLGSRSGNRGTCAGPCRLPYKAYCDGKQLNHTDALYQLSLKDLCSLDILPQLMDAGIDSFKIEGRMKSKEYVACVTSMYRTYIDAYLSDPESYRVSERDKDRLRQDFSRGSLETGYYFIHSGRQLVTLQRPGYHSFTQQQERENTAQCVQDNRMEEEDSAQICLTAFFAAKKGQPLSLTVVSQDGTAATVTGAAPQEALTRPSNEQDVKKALSKTGNTPFSFRRIEIEMEPDLFFTHKMLNELRREALERFTQTALSGYRRERVRPRDKSVCCDAGAKTQENEGSAPKSAMPSGLHIGIQTLQQLEGLDCGNVRVSRIYISFDCFLELCACMKARYEAVKAVCMGCRERGTLLYLSLPAVARQCETDLLHHYQKQIEAFPFDGFLVNHLEGLQYVRKHFRQAPLVSDSRFYIMNTGAACFLGRCGVQEHLLAYELHEHEIRRLTAACVDEEGVRHRYILPIYGYIPVMETAGCILNTNGCCKKGQAAQVQLRDRQNKSWTVIRHCQSCTNTIYNTYPLSLHKEIRKWKTLGVDGVSLFFTKESPKEMNRLIRLYAALLTQAEDAAQACAALDGLLTEFTKGHFAKGVE